MPECLECETEVLQKECYINPLTFFTKGHIKLMTVRLGSIFFLHHKPTIQRKLITADINIIVCISLGMLMAYH